MYHGLGFSIIQDLINLSLDKGLTKKGGAWYNYGEEKFQGLDNMSTWLKDNPDELVILKKALLGDNNEQNK